MQESNKLLSLIGKHYKTSYYNHLEKDIIKKIEKQLHIFLLKHAKNTALVYKNSAYYGHYFKIVSRVKKEESMQEKIIRNNDFLLLSDSLGEVNLEYLNKEQDDLLFQYYKQTDDLLGVKILGELNVDVERIFEIIKNHQSNLEDYKIYVLSDINLQPTLMKNNLKIYKLRCKYILGDQDYLFELQIKSQFLSAWGDMEHQQFYKNYEITPIKSSVQDIMNNVAHLLTSIEKVLLTVRESDQQYKVRESFDFLLTKLNDCYALTINQKLNRPYTYDFTTLAGLIYEVLSYKEIETSVFMQRLLDQKIDEDSRNIILESSLPEVENLIELSRKSYDLQVLILIIKDILKSSRNEGYEMKRIVKMYIELITFKYLQNEKKEDFIEVKTEKKALLKSISNILRLTTEPNVFFLDKRFLIWGLFSNNLFDMIFENDLIDENEKQGIIEQLSTFFGIYIFGGDLKIIRKEIITIEEYILVDNLEKFIEQFKTSEEKNMKYILKIISELKFTFKKGV